jgi:hypothetical protein
VKKTLLALALLFPLVPSARAGIVIYSYAGSSSAPTASSMNGSFQVDEAAISDGVITLAEIKKVSFTLAVAGFADRSFTAIESVTGAPITVDAQGAPTSEIVLSFPSINDPYGNIGVLTAKVDFNAAGTFPADGYSAVYADDSGIVFSLADDDGGPNWTVTVSAGPAPVPEPSSLALAAIAGVLILGRRATAGF